MTRTRITFVVFLFALSPACRPGEPRPSGVPDENDGIVVVARFGLTIVPVQGTLHYVFIGDSVDEFCQVVQSQGFRAAINASFYDGEALHASHAGWLRIDGKTYASKRDDPQLTHVVRYSRDDGVIDIVPALSFDSPLDSNAIEFQTGPIVIDHDRVTKDLIDGSINGQGEYRRTLLGVVGGNRFYFMTVRERVRLEDLASFLLTLPLFSGGGLSVVNLDGGLSVALFMKSNPELDFNPHLHLPAILGVR